MNYYPFYPGDYARDTAHLSLIEHGALRVLLDTYYSTMAPLPRDPAMLYRITRATTDAERAAVDAVVAQFFYADAPANADASAVRLHNRKADEVLAKSRAKIEKASKAAKIMHSSRESLHTHKRTHVRMHVRSGDGDGDGDSVAEGGLEGENGKGYAKGMNTPSPTRALTDAWMAAYKRAHDGCGYVFIGAKDGTAAARVLKSGLSVAEIIDVAEKAWALHRRYGGEKPAFWCKMASGFASFASHFNQIREETMTVKGATVDREEARNAERAAKRENEARVYWQEQAGKGNEVQADGLRFLTDAQLVEQRRLFPDGPAAKAVGGNGAEVAAAA